MKWVTKAPTKSLSFTLHVYVNSNICRLVHYLLNPRRRIIGGTTESLILNTIIVSNLWRGHIGTRLIERHPACLDLGRVLVPDCPAVHRDTQTHRKKTKKMKETGIPCTRSAPRQGNSRIRTARIRRKYIKLKRKTPLKRRRDILTYSTLFLGSRVGCTLSRPGPLYGCLLSPQQI